MACHDRVVLESVMELCAPVVAAPDAAAASRGFDQAARRRGASYLQTRSYRRPSPLTSQTHFAAGGVVLRSAPDGWVGSAAFNYICFDNNPLLEPIRRGLTRYRFGDFAPFEEAEYRDYWDALGECGIAEALCASAYGVGGRVTSIHLGLPERGFDPATVRVLELGAAILVETLLALALADGDGGERGDAGGDTPLTARERDVLAFVAEGKTDWEIGTIMGVAESTARFHADNARRKLKAVNRAHAVARFVARYPL